MGWGSGYISCGFQGGGGGGGGGHWIKILLGGGGGHPKLDDGSK